MKARQVTIAGQLVTFQADAYAVEVLLAAGVHGETARKLLADGPAAVPERPRLALAGRKRGPATTAYVWGPDAAALLSEPAQGGRGGVQ